MKSKTDSSEHDPLLLQRLTLPKYLLKEADRILQRPGLYSYGLAISVIQDAAESFLRLIAIRVPTVRANANQSFSEILGRVAEKVGSVDRHKFALSELNAARVMFKHRGQSTLLRNDVVIFAGNVMSFITDVCKDQMGIDFATVSLANAIGHRRTQNWIEKAEEAFARDDFFEALQNASGALAIYLAHDSQTVANLRRRRPPIWAGRLKHAGLVNQMVFNEGKAAPPFFLRDLTDFARWAEREIGYSNERLQLMARGVDMSAFDDFRAIAPTAHLMANGEVQFVVSHSSASLTANDARLSIDTVIDAVLALDSNRPGQRYGVQENSIKVTVTRKSDVIVHPHATAPEIICEIHPGEVLEAPSNDELPPEMGYVRILQDGDYAYVQRDCVEIPSPEPNS